MVRETLGDQIDIHGGGRDLIFPHHENELAQSEAYTDVHPFVRYWAHAGLVTTGTEKMAHSLENFTTIASVLDVYEPMAVRLFLLQTHYRSSILYTREALDNAVKALDRLRGALEGYDGPPAGAEPPAWAREARAAFERAMDDDFNTPGALGALFDLVREINRRRGGRASWPTRSRRARPSYARWRRSSAYNLTCRRARLTVARTPGRSSTCC